MNIRETSRTHTPDGDEIYASCEIEVTAEGVVYQVQSIFSPHRISVPFESEMARAFFLQLLEAKQSIKKHDETVYLNQTKHKVTPQHPEKEIAS